jgi:hypothetical protein
VDDAAQARPRRQGLNRNRKAHHEGTKHTKGHEEKRKNKRK